MLVPLIAPNRASSTPLRRNGQLGGGGLGADITRPTLYLHGTQDGCHGMTHEQVNRVPDHCGPGSQSELIDGAGYFMMVQRPTDINKRILEFLAA